MSIKAAETFASVVQKVRQKQQEISGGYYKKFIGGKEDPSPDDVARFSKFLDETNAVAKAWHTIVPQAVQGFGGPGDNILSGDRAMLKTMRKKAQDAAAAKPS